MKILIITYYWPPSGGSGVQRWLKFVKYLQDFGVEPVVYTVDNPKYPILDVSLENEIPKNITILKQPIWEPNNILSFFKKKNTQQSAGFLNPNPTFFGRILQYVRANYFIPDARKFWIKPSVKFLKKYVKEHKIDAVITSGPPHSLHLIGLELKKELNIKWISDFRDPWTEIDYFEQLPLTKKSIQIHQQLEQEVVENSDAVLVIGKTMKENFSKFSKNIHVITNGFDNDINSASITLDKKFTITHVGLMNADRNPISLWKTISEICKENDAFAADYQIQFVGKIASEVRESLKEYQIKKITDVGYVSHQEVTKYQQKSQVLLLAVNNVKSAKGIITGKIFEYLQAKRPILAIGPIDGDLAEILKETNSGIIVDFDAVENLKKEILQLYNSFKNRGSESNSSNIEQYHRRNLTEKLANIIKETVS
ncbi:glycosyltransferase family 4 protein [Polaribacter uvawellassae]|uniref:glycosyltransferase family 4 protein n=1 Tax=Polaribacter uvawellassae TaxID=3133495 RepID=UPI00321B7CA8